MPTPNPIPYLSSFDRPSAEAEEGSFDALIDAVDVRVG
jgi:hypothetical protein